MVIEIFIRGYLSSDDFLIGCTNTSLQSQQLGFKVCLLPALRLMMDFVDISKLLVFNFPLSEKPTGYQFLTLAYLCKEVNTSAVTLR